jgi:NTP pyrophosphatase (non-canonical NTP hydrolase)
MEITMEQISEITGIRIEVLIFATEMERKLRANDGKGGWNECSANWLMDRLNEERKELINACSSGNRRRIINECADVANFAMMISDNVK